MKKIGLRGRKPKEDTPPTEDSAGNTPSEPAEQTGGACEHGPVDEPDRGNAEQRSATGLAPRTPGVGKGFAGTQATQWLSSEAVVIGRPSPVFEPAAVKAEYRATPYRADTVLDGWSSQSFVVRGASLRGHNHRYDGTPRQDDFAIRLLEDRQILLVAVADGVSAASQSHIGSTTAVRYAMQWLEASLADPVEETDWRALTASAAWALVEQSSSLFGIETSAEEAEPLIATTLVCAVVEARSDGSASAHVVGVGDSGAWLLGGNGFTKVEGGKVDSGTGLSSSAVAGLPRVPTHVAAATTQVAPGEALLLGTDGFGDPLGGGTGDVGRLFAEALGSGRIPSLFEFGHKLDFSRETFDDDRTLVAIWPKAAEAQSA